MTKALGVLFLLFSFGIFAQAQETKSLAEDQPWETSVAQLEEADNPENLLGLAESLLSQERYSDAKKMALEVLRREPDNTGGLVVLAKACMTLDEFEQAQSSVARLLEKEPENPDHMVLQSMIFLLTQAPAESISFLERAIEKAKDIRSDDQLASYSNTLVLAYHQDGNKAQALKVCLDALSSYPEDPNLHLTCSRLHREKGDFQAALEVAQKGLEVAPDFPNLYASVALAAAGLGDDKLSEEAFQEVQRRAPHLAQDLRATLDGIRQDKAEIQLRTD